MERSKCYSQGLYNIVQNEQAEIEQEEIQIVNELRVHQQTRKIGSILKEVDFSQRRVFANSLMAESRSHCHWHTHS